jgi:hypothetical protein
VVVVGFTLVGGCPSFILGVYKRCLWLWQICLASVRLLGGGSEGFTHGLGQVGICHVGSSWLR